VDLKMLHRDVGQLTLISGTIGDAVGWFLLAVVSAMVMSQASPWRVGLTLLSLVGFVLVAAVLGRPLVRWCLRAAGRGQDRGPTTVTAVAVILGGAILTGVFGLETVFGAFVAGVLISAARADQAVPPGHLSALQTFVTWVAAPVFLASAGLRMDLAALANPTVLVAALTVLTVAVGGKFIGAYLGGRLSRLPRRECLALGAGMNARGIIEITIALTGLRLGVLTPAMYTIITLVAVATSMMAAPVLRWAMAGTDHTAEERLRELAQAD